MLDGKDFNNFHSFSLIKTKTVLDRRCFSLIKQVTSLTFPIMLPTSCNKIKTYIRFLSIVVYVHQYN